MRRDLTKLPLRSSTVTAGMVTVVPSLRRYSTFASRNVSPLLSATFTRWCLIPSIVEREYPMPSLAACRPFIAGLLPTTTSTSGAKPEANSSRRISSMLAYRLGNQCVMAARSLCCVLRIDSHLGDSPERGIDGFEIVPLHDLPKLALLGAIGRSIDELQRKAEP